MKLAAIVSDLKHIETDLLGLGVRDGKLISPLGKGVDQELNLLLTRIIEREGFKGKTGESRLVDTGRDGIEAVLLLGMGEKKKFDTDLLRRLAAVTVKAGRKIRAKKATLEDLSESDKISPEERGQAVAEGAVLASYRFEMYKSRDENVNGKSLSKFEVVTSKGGGVDKGLRRGEIFGEATNYARELINIPASDMTPRRMAEEARKIGRLPGFSVKIYDRRAIEKMGMGCYLAVAKGSEEPPYFIHLTYRPPRKTGKIAIIGKGITFDSGGLSLKTAQSMETMKDDMSGAAAVLALMKGISRLRPSVEVHGISAVAENMPSGKADRPGDVARSMSGKTVEILNTDAEGRLTLADALTYALRLKPEIVVDCATLTGACVIALGELCSAVLGNDQKLVDRLIEAGRRAGEKLWQLPLIEEYKEELKSQVADLKNVGGRWGGTINGALFLQEFADPKVPWAHIDIAGPSWTEKELDCSPRGGTGHIVRTLLHFITSS